MKTVKQFLTEADPVRHENAPGGEVREYRLRNLLDLASNESVSPSRPVFRGARYVVPAVILGTLLIAVYAWSPLVFEARAEVRFEIRLAEDGPGPGLQEAKVAGSNKFVYLHDDVLLSNGDVTRTQLVESGGEYRVGVEFSATAAERLRTASATHIGRPVAILIDDRVVMAPVLRSALGSAAEITGNFTREDAERIVQGIVATGAN